MPIQKLRLIYRKYQKEQVICQVLWEAELQKPKGTVILDQGVGGC